jgi:hypothetical protein
MTVRYAVAALMIQGEYSDFVIGATARDQGWSVDDG